MLVKIMQTTSNTTASEICRDQRENEIGRESKKSQKQVSVALFSLICFGFFEREKENPTGIVLFSFITLSWSLGYVTSFPGTALHF